MDELQELNNRILSAYENKEIPKELKDIIEEAQKEYVQICNNYLSENSQNSDIEAMIHDVVKYSESNYERAIMQAQNYYNDYNNMRINRTIVNIKKIEDEQGNGKTLSEREEIIKNSIGDKVNIYTKASTFTDIIIDCLQDSRDQFMRKLEARRTQDKTKDFINDQIILIEKKTKILMGTKGFEALQMDNEQVTQDIIREYEEYIQEKESNTISDEQQQQIADEILKKSLQEYEEKIEIKKDEGENSSKDFKTQYEVSDEVKEQIEKTSKDFIEKEEEQKNNKIVKESLELPGDLLD